VRWEAALESLQEGDEMQKKLNFSILVHIGTMFFRNANCFFSRTMRSAIAPSCC
jgi:hypothetical protein